MDTVDREHLVCEAASLPAPNQVAQLTGSQSEARPHIVIIGAGFGGLAAAKSLAKAPVRVTLIDRRNYHLFQLLLYQVATAGLSPADIAVPIRSILSRQRNATVVLDRVTGVASVRRVVLTETREIPYDILIVATGSRHAYFGHREWENVAPGLKKIEDATDIRRKILLSFELAENTDDLAERRRLLNFVIVGGGPTGVELAGAVAELARKAKVTGARPLFSDPVRAARWARENNRAICWEAACRVRQKNLFS
jgi:NADH dehydrogenase